MLYKSLSYSGAGVIHGCYHDCDGDHLRAGSPVIEQADVLLKEEADAAATGETDDGRHAHIDVPAVHGERYIGSDDLRHDRIHDHLDAVSAGSCYCFQRTSLDALNLF